MSVLESGPFLFSVLCFAHDCFTYIIYYLVLIPFLVCSGRERGVEVLTGNPVFSDRGVYLYVETQAGQVSLEVQDLQKLRILGKKLRESTLEFTVLSGLAESFRKEPGLVSWFVKSY